MRILSPCAGIAKQHSADRRGTAQRADDDDDDDSDDMAEAMKPTMQVLLAADCKGAQIGSAAGLALALPYAAYKGDQLTLGGAACMAGTGMVVGSTLMVVRAGAGLVGLSKEQLEDKAKALCVEKVDKACVAAAVAGVAVGVRRVVEKEGALAAVCSKRGAWTMLAYGALGVGVVYGAYVAVKGGKQVVEKVSAKIEERKNAPNGTDEVKDEVESAVKEVADAVENAVADEPEAKAE